VSAANQSWPPPVTPPLDGFGVGFGAGAEVTTGAGARVTTGAAVWVTTGALVAAGAETVVLVFVGLLAFLVFFGLAFWTTASDATDPPDTLPTDWAPATWTACKLADELPLEPLEASLELVALPTPKAAAKAITPATATMAI
jgi:hypothetical protein